MKKIEPGLIFSDKIFVFKVISYSDGEMSILNLKNGDVRKFTDKEEIDSARELIYKASFNDTLATYMIVLDSQGFKYLIADVAGNLAACKMPSKEYAANFGAIEDQDERVAYHKENVRVFATKADSVATDYTQNALVLPERYSKYISHLALPLCRDAVSIDMFERVISALSSFGEFEEFC